jgi:hypothetical protein
MFLTWSTTTSLSCFDTRRAHLRVDTPEKHSEEGGGRGEAQMWWLLSIAKWYLWLLGASTTPASGGRGGMVKTLKDFLLIYSCPSLLVFETHQMIVNSDNNSTYGSTSRHLLSA